MVCPHCAFPNEAGAHVCVKCHRPMKDGPSEMQAKPNWLAEPHSDGPVISVPPAPKAAPEPRVAPEPKVAPVPLAETVGVPVPEAQPKDVMLHLGSPSVQGRLVWSAPFWARGLAMGLDVLLVAGLVGLMLLLSSAVLGESASTGLDWAADSLGNVFILFVVFMALLLAYVTMFANFGGQTLGKMLFGLRVIRLDGHGLSWPRALLRSMGMLLAALPGLAGFLWAAFDLDRRGWHDKFAGTMVVRILPPRSVLAREAPESAPVEEEPDPA